MRELCDSLSRTHPELIITVVGHSVGHQCGLLTKPGELQPIAGSEGSQLGEERRGKAGIAEG